jgi:hypothetical protein
MHINDGDEAIGQIEFIVALAMQVDDLDAIAARRVRAEIAARLQGLQAALLADERELRLHGHGDNHVVPALDEITRARSALLALERAVDDRWCAEKSANAEKSAPARWVS